MKVKLPKSLLKLSEIFCENNSKLYIVGGFVRNALLGFCETDIDICGPMPFFEVEKILQNSEFNTKLINKKLGTLHIKHKKSKIEFEYTTFRQESYEKGGFHSPTNIVFVNDIKKDVKRRDFTCNAIYYDIKNEEIVDLCGGVLDTKNKLLKTVEAPLKTFDDDGLRILRLVRMSCELDFEIETNTLVVAKQKISNLKDISQERFNKEIFSILFSDLKYKTLKNQHSPKKGVELLCDLGAFGYIFRQISKEQTLKQVNKCLSKEWAKNFKEVPAIHMLSVFCYEVLKALKMMPNFENIEKILGANGLVCSKKEVLLQSSLICAVEELKTLKNTQTEMFIQQNFENISRILALARFYGLGENVRQKLNLMKQDGVPMTKKDLKISSQDLMELFPNIAKVHYSKVFLDLLKQCLIMPELNTKQNLVRYLKGKNYD